MQKVYGQDDFPDPASTSLATSVAALAKQIPVRSTSAQLSQKQFLPNMSGPNMSGTDLEKCLGLMASLVQRAKAMDEPKITLLSPRSAQSSLDGLLSRLSSGSLVDGTEGGAAKYKSKPKWDQCFGATQPWPACGAKHAC